MLKRLLISSVTAVLRHPLDGGIQVCPPLDRKGRHDSTSGHSQPPRLLGGGAENEESVRADDPLMNARIDFIETLSDIRTQQVGDLLRRIRNARSLRELWFLRAEVFSIVAQHRDQSEAAHRMAKLAAHFPRQVARSAGARMAAAACCAAAAPDRPDASLAMNTGAASEHAGARVAIAAPFGAPQERLARIAARRDFVAMKQAYMDAVADITDSTAEMLRYKVRRAGEAWELWSVRAVILASLRPDHERTSAHRTKLSREFDSIFGRTGA